VKIMNNLTPRYIQEAVSDRRAEEVLDLGETRQVAAPTARVIPLETPASGEPAP
jgi:hypothetical protein